MAEPARTHAIVVGIESYARGEAWNIPGPASDALEFAAWLRDRGVPAKNVSLFLAPLAAERDALLARADGLGFPASAIGAPTLANVEDSFDAVESIEDGELLFVFWSGHGVINRADQRVLFTADATEKTRRNLPINQRLMRLTDQAFKGFREQIAIVDACADFIERMRWPSETSAAPVVNARRRADVRQAILFGAMAGEAAAVNLAERYGKFARFVIGEFGKPGVGLPPDMDAVARAAIAYFEKQNAAGGGQRPVYCRVRGFDQNEEEIIGEQPMPATAQAAARRAKLSAPQLGRLFDALEPCSQIETRAQRDALLAAVLPAADGVARSSDRAADTESCLRAIAGHDALGAMFEWLTRDELPQSEKMAAMTGAGLHQRMAEANDVKSAIGDFALTTPAITSAFLAVTADPYSASRPEGFVHALEKLLGEADENKDKSRVGRFLIRLEHECKGDAQLPAELLENYGFAKARANELRQRLVAARPRRPRLVIDLHGHDRLLDDPGWPRKLRGWLQYADGNWGPYHELAADGSADDTARAFDELVNWGWKQAQREPTIELIVPRCLMAVAFETWKVSEPLAPPRPVGARHPLVLRWGERFWIEALQVRWRSRSEQLGAALAAADPDIRWVASDAAAHPDTLQSAIENDPTCQCVGLEFPPEAAPADLTQDPLVATLRAGVSYALWFRELPADVEALKQAALLLLVSDGVDNFPEGLQRMRANPAPEQAELAERLTVLWDDPAGLPPLNSASEP